MCVVHIYLYLSTYSYEELDALCEHLYHDGVLVAKQAALYLLRLEAEEGELEEREEPPGGRGGQT